MLVRRVAAADVPDLARTLVRAFADDPVANYLIPSDRRRPTGLYHFFRLQMIRDLLPFGHVYTTDDLAGGALWAPPGKPQPTGLQAIRTMIPAMPATVGRGWPRVVRAEMQTLAMRPRRPLWYLAVLGTEPDRQGQGIGSALLQPVLGLSDAGGIGCYLETSKERNIPFYGHHGFEVVREVRLAGSGPTIWTMWRDPRPPDGASPGDGPATPGP